MIQRDPPSVGKLGRQIVDSAKNEGERQKMEAEVA